MFQSSQPSLIIDPNLLRASHIPDKIIDRDDQIEQVLRCLNPAIVKCKPIHVWFYGKPGTGKTTVAHHVLNLLQSKYNTGGLIINCWEKNTFYDILDEMTTELRILRADEHRASFKLEKLRKHLSDKPFVVVLDEIDRIKPRERSMTLYNLHSILNVGLICISATQKTVYTLEERVRSRLHPHVVFFPEYSQKSLSGILCDRAQIALVNGSWSEKTLNKIAELAGGDARVALRMLRKSALAAEQRYLDNICTKNLEEESKATCEAKRASLLVHLTEDHRILYELVRNNGSILSGDLWQKYLQHCETAKRKPLAPRTFSDYANRLVQSNLIMSERARVKGKVRLFKIVV